MRLPIILLALVLKIPIAYSQTPIANSGYSSFQIKEGQQVIDFIIADTNFSEQKPILLFCQGSQPIPLVIDFGNDQPYPIALSNFNVDSLRKHFYTVVISKPYTPIIASQNQLNNQYQYITDSANAYSYDTNYLRADNLNSYVTRANAVINFLNQQPWANTNKLVIAGHSQGAREAVAITAQNKNVTHLGLFGYDFRPRINQNINRILAQERNHQINANKADSLLQEEYAFYQMALNPDSVNTYPELVSWKSFSINQLPQLLHIEIPIYLCFGSADYNAKSSSLLPLRFAESGKTNLTTHRVPNVEHNFFPLLPNGQPDYQNGQWATVMNKFIRWVSTE